MSGTDLVLGLNAVSRVVKASKGEEELLNKGKGTVANHAEEVKHNLEIVTMVPVQVSF